MGGLPSLLSLFHKEFNKFNNRSMNVRFHLLHDIKIILKSHFRFENVKILPSFTQCH